MPPKTRKTKAKATTPKDLCVYLAEPSENGVVLEDIIFFVQQCVTDKIFSLNQDHIAICRTDSTSSASFGDIVSWDPLKKLGEKYREVRQPDKDKFKGSPIASLLDLCKTIAVQDSEDSYDCKKVLFFGLLKSHNVDKNEVVKLGKSLKSNNIQLSIILPDKLGMTDMQIENTNVLKSVLESEEFEDFVFICNFTSARKQIFNVLSQKPKRAMPWNVPFEIGPDLRINVSGYVCTRKNNLSELRKGYIKDHPEAEILESQNEASTSGNGGVLVLYGENNSATDIKPCMVEEVEIAGEITDKEVLWKEKDGTVVNEDDVGKAYIWGDKVVPIGDIEKEDLYHSGEKCLKLIVFCPRSKILPAYLQGDGTTLFYSTKNDAASEAALDALVEALHKSDRVAVVRKVYRKESKVCLGVLSPDIERRCLVFTEICMADDVSVPYFPQLFKQEESSEDDDGSTLTTSEQMIDDLILGQSLDGFHPFQGPVDPAVANLRRTIASKILDPSSSAPPPPDVDNIEMFFNNIVIKNELTQKLRESFPLKFNKEQVDRAAGANIFRKRSIDENEVEVSDKKLKLEDATPTPTEVDVPKEEPDVDYDNVLDLI